MVFSLIDVGMNFTISGPSLAYTNVSLSFLKNLQITGNEVLSNSNSGTFKGALVVEYVITVGTIFKLDNDSRRLFPISQR